jgi:hypothetical protein
LTLILLQQQSLDETDSVPNCGTSVCVKQVKL